MTSIVLTQPVKEYIRTQISHELKRYFGEEKIQKTKKTSAKRMSEAKNHWLKPIPWEVEKKYIHDEITFYEQEKIKKQKPSFTAKDLISNIEKDESD